MSHDQQRTGLKQSNIATYQLDANEVSSVSYQLTKNVKVSLEAINLTDEKTVQNMYYA